MHACILQDVLETSVLSVINAQEQDVRDEYLIFFCASSATIECIVLEKVVSYVLRFHSLTWQKIVYNCTTGNLVTVAYIKYSYPYKMIPLQNVLFLKC